MPNFISKLSKVTFGSAIVLPMVLNRKEKFLGPYGAKEGLLKLV